MDSSRHIIVPNAASHLCSVMFVCLNLNLTMRLLSAFLFLYGLVLGAAATSNNLTDQVTWDRYSLSVNGNRTYI